MKVGTVALIIRLDKKKPQLVDFLSDDREIVLFEEAFGSGKNTPLEMIYQMRTQQQKEDEEFGNYVEELLSRPFVKRDIQEHGVQWLKSKIRIEQFRSTETEAAQVIAKYAFQLFQEDPNRKEYFLAGASAQVKIKVFTLPSSQEERSPLPNAA